MEEEAEEERNYLAAAGTPYKIVAAHKEQINPKFYDEIDQCANDGVMCAFTTWNNSHLVGQTVAGIISDESNYDQQYNGNGSFSPGTPWIEVVASTRDEAFRIGNGGTIEL